MLGMRRFRKMATEPFPTEAQIAAARDGRNNGRPCWELVPETYFPPDNDFATNGERRHRYYAAWYIEMCYPRLGPVEWRETNPG